MRHTADDCLSALGHRDLLDPDGLIASASVSFERLYLRRERPGELVESAFRAVLLRGIFHIGEPTREFHRRHMNSGHLRRKHGFHLVFWLRAFTRFKQACLRVVYTGEPAQLDFSAIKPMPNIFVPRASTTHTLDSSKDTSI